MATTGTIPAAEALRLADLITPTERGIASHVLAKTGGGRGLITGATAHSRTLYCGVFRATAKKPGSLWGRGVNSSHPLGLGHGAQLLLTPGCNVCEIRDGRVCTSCRARFRLR